MWAGTVEPGTVELEWVRLEKTGTVELDREQAGTAKLESEVDALGRVALQGGRSLNLVADSVDRIAHPQSLDLPC